MKHGRKVNKEVEDWMSQGLDHTISHFNEMFINNLSLSFNKVFEEKDGQEQKAPIESIEKDPSEVTSDPHSPIHVPDSITTDQVSASEDDESNLDDDSPDQIEDELKEDTEAEEKK